MLKKLTFASVGIILLASPLAASADQMSDLQAQLKALLAQIAALQHQTPAPLCVDLPVTLTLGSTGDDVGHLFDFHHRHFTRYEVLSQKRRRRSPLAFAFQRLRK